MGDSNARAESDRKIPERPAAFVESFTYDEYGEILFALSSAGYKLVGYHEQTEPPSAAIRHDIDMCMHKALPMAVTEQSFSVKATYCVMARSDAYNVFSAANSALVEKIISMGHWFGLHFDCGAYPELRTVEETAAAIRVEVGMLEKWFGVQVELVSFHKPNQLVLGGNPALTDPLPHAYMTKFMRGAKYFSDSYGFWRYGHPLKSRAFEKRKALALSCHPLWWSDEPSSPLWALNQAMRRKKEEVRQYMLTQIVGV